MNKKSGQILLILLAVLFILCVALFGIKKSNQSEKKEVTLAFKAENITTLSYQDVSGKQMEFEKKNDEWVYLEDETIKLNQDSIENMVEAFQTIEAVRKLENPDSLEDYGLTEPRYQISLTANGEAYTLLIGNTTGEEVYFSEKGKKEVYTVGRELEDHMVWELKTLAKQEEFPYIDPKTFVSMLVTKSDGTQEEIKADDTEAIVKDVTESLSNLYFTDCVDYHVTEESLASYGLTEEERTTVKVVSQENDLEFYVGKKDEKEAYYYVQLEGSQRVHRVLVSGIDGIFAWN